jgi:hypothetical protein
MVAGTLFLCGSCLGYAFWFIIQVPYWYWPWNLEINLDFHIYGYFRMSVTMSQLKKKIHCLLDCYGFYVIMLLHVFVISFLTHSSM